MAGMFDDIPIGEPPSAAGMFDDIPITGGSAAGMFDDIPIIAPPGQQIAPDNLPPDGGQEPVSGPPENGLYDTPLPKELGNATSDEAAETFAPPQNDQELLKLQERMATGRKEIEALNPKVSEIGDALTALKAPIDELEQKIAPVRQQVERFDAFLTQRKKQLDDLQRVGTPGSRQSRDTLERLLSQYNAAVEQRNALQDSIAPQVDEYKKTAGSYNEFYEKSRKDLEKYASLLDIDSQIEGVMPKAPESSPFGAFARGAERGALPAVGGTAGFGAGMAIGAPLGATLGALGGPYAPVTVPVGTAIGGVGLGTVGAFGGAAAAGAFQQWLLGILPQSVRDFVGQDVAQQQSDMEQNPYSAFAGELAPNLALMRPSFKALPKWEPGTPVYKRIFGSSTASRLAGAGLMGAQEAAQEEVGDEPIDIGKVAISAGLGALMNRQTRLGEAVMGLGVKPVGAVVDMFRGPGGGAPGSTGARRPPPSPRIPPAGPATVDATYSEVPDDAGAPGWDGAGQQPGYAKEGSYPRDGGSPSGAGTAAAIPDEFVLDTPRGPRRARVEGSFGDNQEYVTVRTEDGGTRDYHVDDLVNDIRPIRPDEGGESGDLASEADIMNVPPPDGWDVVDESPMPARGSSPPAQRGQAFPPSSGEPIVDESTGEILGYRPPKATPPPDEPFLPEPKDGQSEAYYVTMVREPGTPAQRTAFLAGPFQSQEEAGQHVDAARAAASAIDPFSDFDAFGVSKRTAKAHPPGTLNKQIGVEPPILANPVPQEYPTKLDLDTVSGLAHEQEVQQIEDDVSRERAKKREAERLRVPEPEQDEPVQIGDTAIEDSYRDEQFGTKLAKIGDRIVAGADLSITPDEVWIRNIQTAEGDRRKGYATQLLDDVFREFPGHKIIPSGMTDDGSRFFAGRYDRDEAGFIEPRGRAVARMAQPEEAPSPAPSPPTGADRILQEAEDIAKGSAALKTRATVYDGAAKAKAARANGLPEDAYDYLPYEEWMKIRGGDGTRAAPIKIEAPEHIEAARNEVDTTPTPAEAAAGNYKKAHVEFQGLPISIETPKGAERVGRDDKGNVIWRNTNPLADYGDIKRSTGADGDNVDVYIGHDPKSDKAFVIDQFEPKTGKFDETKTVLGVNTQDEAIKVYDAGFSDGSGPDRRRGVTDLNIPQFKNYVKNGDHSVPAAEFFTSEPSPQGEPVAIEERPVDSRGYPIFKEGDRVVIPSDHIGGDHAGRHGVVVKATGMRMQAIFGGPASEEVSYNYDVKTDHGGETFAAKLEPETGEPPPFAEDPKIGAHYWSPQAVQRSIENNKRSAERYQERAVKARKQESKDGWRNSAKQALAEAAERQAILDAWKRKNPEEAARIFAPQGGITEKGPAPTPAGNAPSGNAPSAPPAAPRTDVTVRENAAKGGVEVKFKTKPSDDDLSALKGAGFRWSKPQKLWYAKNTPKTLAVANSFKSKPAPSGQTMSGPPGVSDIERPSMSEPGISTAKPPERGPVAKAEADPDAFWKHLENRGFAVSTNGSQYRIVPDAGSGYVVMRTDATRGRDTLRPLGLEAEPWTLDEARAKALADAFPPAIPQPEEERFRDLLNLHGQADKNGKTYRVATYLSGDGSMRNAVKIGVKGGTSVFDGETHATKADAIEHAVTAAFGAARPSQATPSKQGGNIPVGKREGQAEWREIGKNRDGKPLHEDQRGVRSISENGVRYSEPVGLRPTKTGGMELSVNRSENPEFEIATPEQIAARQAEVEAAKAEMDKATYQPSAMPPPQPAPQPPERKPFEPGDMVHVRPESGGNLPVNANPRGVVDAGGDRGNMVTLNGGATYKAADLSPVREDGSNALPGSVPDVVPGQTPRSGPQVSTQPSAEPRPKGAPSGEDARSGGSGGPTGSVRTKGGGRPAKGPSSGASDRGGGTGPDAGHTRPGEVPDPRASERPEEVTGQNYRIEPGALDEERGPMQKARDNLAAIRLSKQIKAEGRLATADEQRALAKYVGWGGLANAFEQPDGSVRPEFAQIEKELKSLLTPEEYREASSSTQYAHYTSEAVIGSMWNAVTAMGFKGGSVFEPGMGVGHFRGLMPGDVAARSEYQGIEYDPVTADIAKLLYPKDGVRQADFIETPIPENSFDLVIGNPPFSKTVITADPKYAARGFMLHDYFFVKSMDSLKPGGVLAFVTSAGTMNKIDDSARVYLAERAEFLGGVRLPSSAFKKNAGTEVTTDILFFQKRHDPISKADAGREPWLGMVQRDLPGPDGKPVKGNVSRYFSEHPEAVLGEEGFFDKLYKDRYAVRPTPGRDYLADLRGAVATLPKNLSWPVAEEGATALDFMTDQKKDGSFYLKGGVLHQYNNGVGSPVSRRGKGQSGFTPAQLERVKALVPIRDALRSVYAADLAEDADGGDIARKQLNASYDAFVGKFGPVNKAEITENRPNRVQMEGARAEARENAIEKGVLWDDGSFDPMPFIAKDASFADIARERDDLKQRLGPAYREGSFNPNDVPDIVTEKLPNIEAFMDDPESYRLRAIEAYEPETGVATKKRIFFESILTRETEPQIKSANDGVLWSLNKFGRLDLAAIGEKLNKRQDEVVAELGDAVFQVPGASGVYQMADEYLSGDIPDKLAIARDAAERNPDFERNVGALEASIPPPLAPSEITMRLGMPWIPAEDIEEFARSHLEIGSPRIRHSSAAGGWSVGKSYSGSGAEKWGTPDVDAFEILDHALNQTAPRLYSGPKDKRVFDPVATGAAFDKILEMKAAFVGWVQADTDRHDGFASLYNTAMNRRVPRKYDGSYLTTPGVSKDWSWRPHQRRGVARVILSGNTYVAHAVGAGKTSLAIGAGMEMRRLGLVNKPMYVVPKAMLGQFAKEFYEQYPLAKIMVADDRRFKAKRRKQFIATAAQEDLDAIIITQSSFNKIPISGESQKALIDEEIEKLRQSKKEAEGDRITVKALENQIKALQQKIKGATGTRKDATNTFEEMGVDFLFYDEAHLARKLDFASKMKVKGITTKGSERAWDLYAKINYLESKRPGRSVVLMSGTPITNTMAELYTISRFMQKGTLKRYGVAHFDDWASAFGDAITEQEQTATGEYEEVTRFAKFVNMPELYNMVSEVMDVVTPSQLDEYVVRPKVTGGRRQLHIAPRTEFLDEFQADLKRRIAQIKERKGPAKKGDDIILSVINDGRLGAVDPRLITGSSQNANAMAADSKLSMMLDNAIKIYRRTGDVQFHDPKTNYQTKTVRGPAAQIIFSNLGVNPREGNNFSTHGEIKKRLIAGGVPGNEIAFINDYDSYVAKQRLFNDMNAGKVRFLIGSTAKMATGINVQKRLYAIHNLDPLWFPADDEQRIGRILRQGNMNPLIEIHDYSTKGTYDSSMWDMMARKGGFIEQFMRGDPTMREMEDIGEVSAYEQAAAMSTTDERVIVLTQMKQDLEKAERRKQAHSREQYSLRAKRDWAEKSIERDRRRIARTQKDIALRTETAGDKFSMTVGGGVYSQRKDAAEALDGWIKKSDSMPFGETRMVGKIGGAELSAMRAMGAAGDFKFSVRFPHREALAMDVGGTTPIGIIRSAEDRISGLDRSLDFDKKEISQNERLISSVTKLIGKPFDGQAEIDRLRGEVSTLEREIKASAEPVRSGETGDDTEPQYSTIQRTPEQETVGIGADLKRLIDLFGPKMYGSSIPEVTAKELLQNSFDGVKAAVQSGAIAPGEGQINITSDPNSLTLTVSDNGAGMTPETVKGAFLTIAGTSKDDLPEAERSGGFGVAKLAFIFGNESLELETVRNGIRTRLNTTSKELLAGEATLHTEPTDQAPGTTVTVKFPKSIKDKNGEAVPIYMPWDAEAYDALRQPLIGDVTVTGRKRKSDNPKVLPIGKHQPMHGMPLATTAKMPWGSVNIYVAKERNKKDRYPQQVVLSSGFYQFPFTIPDGPNSHVPIPHDMIFDVRPSVDASDAFYPFNNQREGWSRKVAGDIGLMKKYLQIWWYGQKAENVGGSYSTVQAMPVVRDPVGSADDFQPLDLQKYLPGIAANGLEKTITIRDDRIFINGSEADVEKALSAAEATSPKNFRFPKGTVRRDVPLFHSDLNVDLIAKAAKLASVPESDVRHFVALVGTAFQDFRDGLSKVEGYGVWAGDDHPVGISFNTEYHGVHITVPYRGMFVNPASVRGRSPQAIAESIVDTMFHEAVHTNVSGHNESFTTASGALVPAFEDENPGLRAGLVGRIVGGVTKSRHVFDAMRSVFNDKATANIGDDAESPSRSVVEPSRPSGLLGRPFSLREGERLGRILREGSGESVSEGAEGRDLRRPDEGSEYSRIAASAPTFFSALQRGVENVKMEKAPALQWRYTIRNMQGVKKEQIDWSGVDQWLESRKGEPTTKAEVADFIRRNDVQLEEVAKGGVLDATEDEKGDLYKALQRYERKLAIDEETADRLMAGAVQGSSDAIGEIEGLGIDDDIIAPFRDRSRSPTKYGQYVLPGGKNYRELLMMLPSKWNLLRENLPLGIANKLKTEKDVQDARESEHWLRGMFDGYSNKEVLDASKDLLEGRYERGQRDREFRSKHFEEPNIIAHARFDDREGPNGERILHVAEIQSDLHQKGRKEGYRSENLPDGWVIMPMSEARAFVEDNFPDRRWVKDSSNTGYAVVDKESGNTPLGIWGKNLPTEEIARKSALESADYHRVPDFPFKTTWHELAFKRMLRYAAENGFDRLSWDSGETNADRFDLSKSIDRLYVLEGNYEELGGDGAGYQVDAYKGGKVAISKRVTRDDLPNVIGKDMAAKALAAIEENKKRPVPKYSADFRGIDLKVGGEGMRGFYDKILPAFASKYVRKWGSKVEQTTIGADSGVSDEFAKAVAQIPGAGPVNEPAPVWSVAITEPMRASVMADGQPMFSRIDRGGSDGTLRPGTVSKMVAAYNDAIPSYEDQYGQFGRATYSTLTRDDVEGIYGDDTSEWPVKLRDIIEANGSAVEISDGDRAEWLAPKDAPPRDEFIRSHIKDLGGLVPAKDLDDIMRGLGSQTSGAATAAVDAFHVMARDLGWQVSKQPHADQRYMRLERPLSAQERADLESRGVTVDDETPEEITVGIRVSDHANTSRVGHAVHGKAPVHINIAPGAHDFDDAAKMLAVAHYTNDGELSFREDDKTAPMFSRIRRGGEGEEPPPYNPIRNAPPETVDDMENAIDDGIEAVVAEGGGNGDEAAEMAASFPPEGPRPEKHLDDVVGSVERLWIFPRTLAATDWRSSHYWAAVERRNDTASRLMHDAADGSKLYVDLLPSQKDVLHGMEELARLKGLTVEDDGRRLVMRNDLGIGRDELLRLPFDKMVHTLERGGFETSDAKKIADRIKDGDRVTTDLALQRLNPPLAHSKYGQVLAADKKTTAAYFERRKLFARRWRDLMRGFAAKQGWRGSLDPDVIRKTAEDEDVKSVKARLLRLADTMQAMGAQERPGYVHFARFGDYYLQVQPRAGVDLESLGGFPRTFEFRLVESRSSFWEKATTNRDEGYVPDAAREEEKKLRKIYPVSLFDINMGHLSKNPDLLRSLDIPAIDKFLTALGQKDTDKFEPMVEELRDEMYKELTAGFKKRASNTPGYSPDFERATGSYFHWTSHHIAKQVHGDAIKDAKTKFIDTHPSKGTKDYWNKWEAYADSTSEEMQGLRKFGFYWTLAGNPSSAFASAMDGPQVALFTIGIGLGESKTGVGMVGPRLMAAYHQVLAAIPASTNTNAGLDVDIAKMKGLSTEERTGLLKAERAGLFHSAVTEELMGLVSHQRPPAGISRTKWQRIQRFSSSTVSVTDKMTRIAVWLTAHRLSKVPGVVEKWKKSWGGNQVFRRMVVENDGKLTPDLAARFFVEEAAFVFGKKNRPEIQRGRWGAMFFQFRTFQMRYISSLVNKMFRMGPEGRYAAAAMLFGLLLVVGVKGLPFAGDMEDAITSLMKVFKKDPQIDASMHAFMEDRGLPWRAAEMFLHGASRVMFGANVSDRLGFSTPIGDNLDFTDTPAAIFGVVPSILVNAAYGAYERAQHGQPLGAVAEVLPSALRNPYQALVVYPREGVRTKFMYPEMPAVVSPKQLDWGDTLAKAVGFQPSIVARAYENRKFYQDLSAAIRDEAEHRPSKRSAMPPEMKVPRRGRGIQGPYPNR